MSYVRTHYRTVYEPRSISKLLIKSLAEALSSFKAGLPTTSRLLKARAISHGKITDQQGPECWKVVDPHSLADLEHVQVELLLTETDKSSCELHVEFRNEHIFLSVSDIQTGWGKSVHEEMRHLLATLGISSTGFKERVRRAYGLMSILQNILLAVAVGIFSFWLTGHGATYLYAATGLFVAGAMPAVIHSFRFFVPAKKLALVQDTLPKGRGFPLAEASAIVAFVGGLVQLVRELVAFLW